MRRPALIALVALASVLSLFLFACEPAPPSSAVKITLSQAIALSQNNNIASARVEMDKGWMLMTARAGNETLELVDIEGAPAAIGDGTELVAYIGGMSAVDLKGMGFVFPGDFSVSKRTAGSPSGSAGFLVLMPLLLLGLLFIMLIRSGSSARNQMGDFARTKARLRSTDVPTVTFSDVAGVAEVKQDLLEVVEFLKHQEKFQRLGARVPKGVLLAGPPGTGKTLLAKAVAGEAAVPFFSISGSEFVEMFVGVGASRVRDLFQQAKANRPSIIFIDEIDAVGRRRGGGPAVSHEEREQTLNQILSEMDGFTPNSGVIVLAATNRPDVLDPALLRPGRFDRRVMLDAPDYAERRAILDIHTKGKPLDKSVDLDVIAKETPGFSGADLANLVNEAAILAARRDKSSITMEELGEAIDRALAGPAKKSRLINPQDKKRTAYHEAGHALVARLLPDADPVFKVSIVSRGGIGGYTRTLPEEEHYLMTRRQLKANLTTLLGGYCAEEAFFPDISTGPHNDIKRATELARKMITDYGMGEELPLRTFGSEQIEWGMERKDFSEDMARQIDDAVHKLMNEARALARKILEENRTRLVYFAERLIIRESLEGRELKQIFTEPLDGEAGKEKGIPGEVLGNTAPGVLH
ncbi:MAG: ATP-dependent zinc metalloprotease FtsH [Chloroflexi bacterium]|nr:ATP-dependent zinc metalloprotease FtsH [Chloroflexota bacterium]